jgi:hypothetical protein
MRGVVMVFRVSSKHWEDLIAFTISQWNTIYMSQSVRKPVVLGNVSLLRPKWWLTISWE